MSIKKYRKMTIDELRAELLKKRSEISETRFNVRVGKENDYAQIKQERKNLARLITCIKEKEGKESIQESKKSITKKEERKEKVEEVKKVDSKLKSNEKKNAKSKSRK